ncbi:MULTISPECIES: family 43 glycosylhydrolase [Bifidobacterium]|uniref:family 43 glycosylhydrolase n=1 Tax=Bifidobacterium TaxID=1678 RepID=UPI0013D1E366|nr:family 43 glycosylhydrolase [Bifidobacterium saimiriisciurei]
MAAVAAIPMLAAIVPAANAAEATSIVSPTTQAVVAKALAAQQTQSVTQAAATDDVADGSNGYLWLHFEATDYEKIYYGYSADGVTWNKLNDNQPLITSDVANKGIRDPHIIRLHEADADGYKYVMIGTDLHAEGSAGGKDWSQQSKNLIVSKSKDLVNWTKAEAVFAGWDDANRAWAPEAIYDEAKGEYLVYWSSKPNSNTSTPLGVYKSYTKDFKTFTTPERWIDESGVGNANIIDTTIVKGEDGNYYRFSTSDWNTVVDTSPTLDAEHWTRLVDRDNAVNADGTSKLAEYQKANNPAQGDQKIITTSAAGLGGIEGLTVFQKTDGSWVIMGDNQGYRAFTIANLADFKASKGTTKTTSNFPLRFRHGSVMALTAAEQKAVLAAYGDEVETVTPDAAGSAPIATYDFDGTSAGKDGTGSNDLTLNGAAAATDADAAAAQADDTASAAPSGKVLTLDGTSGTYAEFPKGLFDGRNKLTVQMDVKSETAANTNQFTFAFGKSTAKYYFMKYNKGTLANRITVGSYGAESKADATLDGAWHRVTVVLDDKTMTVYSDGQQVAQNKATSATVSDLGKNLIGYLGKSFYSDPYFKGSFDNVKVWNRALAASEISDSGATDPDPDQPTGDVLADFTFDDLKAGATGDINDAGSAAKATIEGTAAVATNDKNNTAAAKVSKDFWLNVTKADGTPLLKGVNDLTVTFDAKPDANNPGWAFYAAPSTAAPVYNKSEHYLGVMAKPGSVSVERYNTDGNRDTRGNASGSATASGWYKVTVTVSDTATRVFVNGALVKESTDVKGLELPSILGEGGGILQLGKANWGSGEYYSGLLDNVKIYGRVLSDKEIEDASPVTLQGINVGSAPTADEAADLRGTDDHSLVRSSLDWNARTVTTVLNGRGDAAKTPVTVSFNRGADTVKLTLDGQAFTNGGTADLTKDRKLVVTYADGTAETWTLKAATVGNNPVLPGQYADPDIDYFDGKFWIFPTTDGFKSWSGNYFHAWSSTDLKNWKDEGVILDVDKSHEGNKQSYWTDQTTVSPWSVGSAWAPTIEKKVINGKAQYFFYYCAKYPNGQSAIGVAVADNPAGPYKAADQPIVTRTMEGVTVGQAIDPSIFTDPKTNKSYILYGNGTPAIAELSDDMMSVKAGTVKKLNGLRNFRESVVVAYRDGKYHWTWSCDDANSPNYHVEYGVSDSIDGAITYKGVLLQKDTSKNLQGTAHQSDVHVTDADGNDRWFMAYHRHYTPLGVFTSGLGYHRETAIDEIHFGEDGLMQTIKPTDEGVGAVKMADTTALDKAIDVAGKVTNDGYTDDSWKAFEDALAAAKKAKQTFLDSGIAQKDVDSATADLAAAQKALAKPGQPDVPVASVAISGDGVADGKLTLKVGASVKLTASVEPENATDTTVAWKSSDETVLKAAAADTKARAAVAGEQTFEALKTGTAKVTATTANGKTATVEVTVVTDGGGEQPGQSGNGSGSSNANGSNGAAKPSGSAGQSGSQYGGNEQGGSESGKLSRTGAAVGVVAFAAVALAGAGVVLALRRRRA